MSYTFGVQVAAVGSCPASARGHALDESDDPDVIVVSGTSVTAKPSLGCLLVVA